MKIISLNKKKVLAPQKIDLHSLHKLKYFFLVQRKGNLYSYIRILSLGNKRNVKTV